MQNLVGVFQNAFEMGFKSANVQPALWVCRENTHSAAVLGAEQLLSKVRGGGWLRNGEGHLLS